VYVFPEGLVRFASKRYSESRKALSQRRVHLTNYSVNKGSGKQVAAAEDCGEEEAGALGRSWVEAG